MKFPRRFSLRFLLELAACSAPVFAGGLAAMRWMEKEEWRIIAEKDPHASCRTAFAETANWFSQQSADEKSAGLNWLAVAAFQNGAPRTIYGLELAPGPSPEEALSLFTAMKSRNISLQTMEIHIADPGCSIKFEPEADETGVVTMDVFYPMQRQEVTFLFLSALQRLDFDTHGRTFRLKMQHGLCHPEGVAIYPVDYAVVIEGPDGACSQLDWEIFDTLVKGDGLWREVERQEARAFRQSSPSAPAPLASIQP